MLRLTNQTRGESLSELLATIFLPVYNEVYKMKPNLSLTDKWVAYYFIMFLSLKEKYLRNNINILYMKIQ